MRNFCRLTHKTGRLIVAFVGEIISKFGGNMNTASDLAKRAGINLAEMSRRLGQKSNGLPVVNTKTLYNWHKNKPELFRVVLLGVTSVDLDS